MNTKIYTSTVQAKEGLDAVLKKCFLTHLTIYNHALELLKADPHIQYVDLREQVFQYVQSNKVQHLHIQIVQNEIYYLHKKFHQGGQSNQKLLSSIQYFTLILRSFNNGIITLDSSRTRLSFNDWQGYLELPTPLPQIPDSGVTLYINLSYSAMENQFQLSVFQQAKVQQSELHYA